jgi:hypothetical protein
MPSPSRTFVPNVVIFGLDHTPRDKSWTKMSYSRYIVEMALKIRDEQGVEEPEQVADLIAEETNEAYKPSVKTVRRWFKENPQTMGSRLDHLRKLAAIDNLSADSFKYVSLNRKEDGNWEASITFLQRDKEGNMAPMAPGAVAFEPSGPTHLNRVTLEVRTPERLKPKAQYHSKRRGKKST